MSNFYEHKQIEHIDVSQRSKGERTLKKSQNLCIYQFIYKNLFQKLKVIYQVVYRWKYMSTYAIFYWLKQVFDKVAPLMGLLEQQNNLENSRYQLRDKNLVREKLIYIKLYKS